MAVFAENSDAVVAAAASALGLPLDFCFRFSVPAPNKHGLPEPAVAGPLTLRCALARYADLLSAPNKAALLALAACAKDAAEAARLQRLASVEGERLLRCPLCCCLGLLGPRRLLPWRRIDAARTAWHGGRLGMPRAPASSRWAFAGAATYTPACPLHSCAFSVAPMPCAAGKDDYHAYVVAHKRSLLEVLQDFPSAKPSLGEGRSRGLRRACLPLPPLPPLPRLRKLRWQRQFGACRCQRVFTQASCRSWCAPVPGGHPPFPGQLAS